MWRVLSRVRTGSGVDRRSCGERCITSSATVSGFSSPSRPSSEPRVGASTLTRLHTAVTDYTPYSRVTPLDALARKTMHELRVSSLATHPTFLSSMLQSLPYYQHARKYFSREALEQIRRTKEQEEDSLEGDETDYGFDERLRVDEIGKLLEGQENHVGLFLSETSRRRKKLTHCSWVAFSRCATFCTPKCCRVPTSGQISSFTSAFRSVRSPSDPQRAR